MKNMFRRRFAKLSTLAVSVASAAVLVVSMTGASATGTFGPDRTTKEWSTQENGFQYVTFNSYTNVPQGIGDERDFFRAVEAGRDSNWTNPLLNVDQNAEIDAKIYIHNDADPLLNDGAGTGIAHNVTVSVPLPTTMAQSQDITATISADNANPGTIFDSMHITGANNGFFQLAEEAGSAQIHNADGSVTNMTPAQEAALFTKGGVNLGDQKGCFQYRREITFKMKVQMPQYGMVKQVRLPGQTAKDWQKTMTVKSDQTIEWTVKFSNIGSTNLNDVAVVDQIPNGLTVVPGSIIVYTSNFPNGTKNIDPNPIQMNGRQINIDIGNYAPLTDAEKAAGDISGQIVYDTTIDASKLQCGNNAFVNKAYVTPSGLGALTDTATANVSKTCQSTPPTTPTTPTTPTKLVNTGPGEVVGLFTGASAAGAFGYRKFLSRRLGR